jgi:hypothetical protein
MPILFLSFFSCEHPISFSLFVFIFPTLPTRLCKKWAACIGLADPVRTFSGAGRSRQSDVRASQPQHPQWRTVRKSVPDRNATILGLVENLCVHLKSSGKVPRPNSASNRPHRPTFQPSFEHFVAMIKVSIWPRNANSNLSTFSFFKTIAIAEINSADYSWTSLMKTQNWIKKLLSLLYHPIPYTAKKKQRIVPRRFHRPIKVPKSQHNGSHLIVQRTNSEKVWSSQVCLPLLWEVAPVSLNFIFTKTPTRSTFETT